MDLKTALWGLLLLLDHIIPHLHRSIDQADQVEGPKARLDRTIMMALDVALG